MTVIDDLRTQINAALDSAQAAIDAESSAEVQLAVDDAKLKSDETAIQNAIDILTPLVAVAPAFDGNNPAPIVSPGIPEVTLSPPVMTDAAGTVVPDMVPGFSTPDRPANP